jgi:RNase P/RNase MRP subunit POP5
MAIKKVDAAIHLGLNQPGFLYLNETVLSNVKSATGDAGKGTVDELKFGPLYDRISDLLFPWCSTLTSRARYFLFTYTVLQLALEKTIPQDKRNPEHDQGECQALAREYLKTFVRHIRRIEKYLAFALIAGEDLDGTFGQRRINRWMLERRGEVSSKSYALILTADSRYPNVIYRAGARALGLFNVANQNTVLIATYLRGEQCFNEAWATAAAGALAEVRRVVEFWEPYETAPSSSLAAVTKLFKKTAVCSAFSGFKLTPSEATFLYERIQASTSYWQKISKGKLRRLYASPVAFSDLEAVFDGIPGHEFLLAAKHIDNVTKYWRHYYAEIVRTSHDAPSLALIRDALPEIRISLDWLNQAAGGTSKAGWEDIWSISYADLIANWADMVSDNCARALANELRARAEVIVHERGRGKVAPHQRPAADREDDLDVELEVQAAAFRLGNAHRILSDIAKAAHG